jgi:hypothetical protein
MSSSVRPTAYTAYALPANVMRNKRAMLTHCLGTSPRLIAAYQKRIEDLEIDQADFFLRQLA